MLSVKGVFGFFKLRHYLEQFRFTAKLGGGYRDFPYSFSSHTCIASPPISITHQNETFVKIYEPTLAHHNYSKFIVYIRVHCWCCTFCWFVQMYNDMSCIHHYKDHAKYFHFPQILCALFISSSSFAAPGNF